MKYILFNLILIVFLYGNSIDNTILGFNTTNNMNMQVKNFDETSSSIFDDFSGEVALHTLYTNDTHQFDSLKGSIFLDYTKNISQNLQLKINGKYYYDAVYDIDSNRFSQEEKDQLKEEFELNEAYISWKLTQDLDILDIKLGRQIVVWGDSDTIRITDVINPLDNRRPGLVDMEYLRLPVNMLKIDYYINNWNIVPILILEQRFSKLPPFGSPFYPMDFKVTDEKYNDVTYGFKIGKDFHNMSINFYTARIHDDEGYTTMFPTPVINHEKITMIGSSLNFTIGSWLLKNENAHLKDLRYTSVNEKTFNRLDILLGLEYHGYQNMTISYDTALRSIENYDNRLLQEINPLEKNTYQHAFRISKNFLNETLFLNYLCSINGNSFFQKSGGLQRVWSEYKINDNVGVEFGIADYIGGSNFYNKTKEQDAIFANLSYNF